ncbi:hypothetical protein [Trichloromonas sp.]|uniref:hypothetical protein n=1 Tax=Trichloromonas sp. TaxID=3069249 RepID=UPI003D8197F1
MEDDITERYNPTTGLIEIRCGHCGNAEEVPTRKREKHEHGPFLPQWIAARKPCRFTRGTQGDCTLRGQVTWNDVVCSECGNMSTREQSPAYRGREKDIRVP